MPVFRFDFELHATQEAIIRRGEVMGAVATVERHIGLAAANDVYEHVLERQHLLQDVPADITYMGNDEITVVRAGRIAVCETVPESEPVRFAGMWIMNDSEQMIGRAEWLINNHPNTPETDYDTNMDYFSPVLGTAITDDRFLIQTVFLGVPPNTDLLTHPDALLLPNPDMESAGRRYSVAGLEEYFAS